MYINRDNVKKNIGVLIYLAWKTMNGTFALRTSCDHVIVFARARNDRDAFHESS